MQPKAAFFGKRTRLGGRPGEPCDALAANNGHPRVISLWRQASAISADAPLTEFVGPSLSTACAIAVGSRVEPTTVSMRGTATPNRATLRHVPPLRRDAGTQDEGDGVGYEHELRLGPVYGEVHPRRVAPSAKRRDETPR